MNKTVSHFIVELLGINLRPITRGAPLWESAQAGACSHCGASIEQGKAYLPVKTGQFFGDTRDLALPSGIVCPACAWLRTKPVLHAMMNAVVVKGALYKLRGKANWTWLLLSPPKAPFVVMSSKAKLAHLAWRAVPTLDEQLIFVRRDNFLFSIAPERLHEMIHLEDRLRARSKNDRAMIFRFMDRSLTHPGIPELSRDALAHLSTEEQHFVASLSPGEYWACTMLLGNYREKPTPPEPFDLSKIRP